MASWEIQDGREKENVILFSKYMSSTQYLLWYNQIFAGILMNVDDFLREAEISMGKKPLNMQHFGNFSAPIWSFLRVPGEAKTLENQISSFCKKCLIPKCLAWSVVSKNAGINWCDWWQTEKSKMASKMVRKVENSVYSYFESQSLPILIEPIVFMVSMHWRWFLMKCMHFSS